MFPRGRIFRIIIIFFSGFGGRVCAKLCWVKIIVRQLVLIFPEIGFEAVNKGIAAVLVVLLQKFQCLLEIVSELRVLFLHDCSNTHVESDCSNLYWQG